METKLTVFLDSVSRTIAGKLSDETAETLTITNPVVVNIVPNANGQMTLQLIPFVFRQILADPNEDISFTYNKATTTMSDITEFTEGVMDQYNGLFVELPDPIEVEADGESKIVPLFPETDAQETKGDE